MKFLVALSALVSTAAAMSDISATSAMGRNLLSKARKVEENNNEEFENTWVAGYSIKFQGCHHIKQWNNEADDDEDVRIETQRLIRFRLCPTGSCSATKAAGCTSGYGDYIIDMDTFMESYWEAKREETEYNCEYYLNNVCNCQDDGNQGDDFNEEYCQYDCFVAADMGECVDRNPYQEDEVEEFEVDEYMQCAQLNVNDWQNNNNNGRKLNEEIQYFVGPYCANQGGSIHLGMFTDDSCSTFADVSFKSLSGFELPYSSESIVTDDCLSCKEKPEQDNNNNNNNGEDQADYNDQQDADEVIETCEMLYTGAGKCEANLPEGTTYEYNNNACNYMQGIRIVRQDGIIDTGSSRPSAVATAFIVIFAMAFAAMAFYVWYLRTRLGVKQNTLL